MVSNGIDLFDYSEKAVDVPVIELPKKAEKPDEGEKPEVKPVEKAKVPEVISKIPVAKSKVPDLKPEVKPKVKPDVKPEVKSEVKPEVKPEVTPEVKPEVKSIEPIAPERIHKKPTEEKIPIEAEPIKTVPFKPSIFEKPDEKPEVKKEVKPVTPPSERLKPESIRSESPIQKVSYDLSKYFDKPEVKREVEPEVRRVSTPSTILKPQSVRSESPIQKVSYDFSKYFDKPQSQSTIRNIKTPTPSPKPTRSSPPSKISYDFSKVFENKENERPGMNEQVHTKTYQSLAVHLSLLKTKNTCQDP